MDAATRELVRRRASGRCEYCLLPQECFEVSHHIEHIVAKQHGGGDDTSNLALACHLCNLHKGPNLAGIDPVSGEVALLFHPRRDLWTAHFRFDSVILEGATPTGRATVQVLAMNGELQLELRRALLARGKLI
jgi:hypothetical protein